MIFPVYHILPRIHIWKVRFRDDPSFENDEVYDEIDRFHQERDERILKDFQKKTSKSADNEVLGVYESESELSDSSEDSIDDRLKESSKVRSELFK